MLAQKVGERKTEIKYLTFLLCLGRYKMNNLRINNLRVSFVISVLATKIIVQEYNTQKLIK